MTQPERAETERHIAVLSKFLDLGQPFRFRDKVLTNEQGHGAMIAGLLTRKGSRLDSAVSEQLTEEYLDAIEDLPAWCVREALRKWNRGESQALDSRMHVFEFRPEPGVLGRLARMELYALKSQIVTLTRILEAQPLPEYTETHKADMRDKLSKSIPWLMLGEDCERGKPQTGRKAKA